MFKLVKFGDVEKDTQIIRFLTKKSVFDTLLILSRGRIIEKMNIEEYNFKTIFRQL